MQELAFRALVEEEATTSCAPSFNHIMCGIPSVWYLSVMTAARSALLLPQSCLRRSACHGALEVDFGKCHDCARLCLVDLCVVCELMAKSRHVALPVARATRMQGALNTWVTKCLWSGLKPLR